MQLITQKNIKLQNMMKVFQEIYRQGSISRQTLASKTGISLMTVGKIVDQLVRCDIASEEKRILPRWAARAMWSPSFRIAKNSIDRSGAA